MTGRSARLLSVLVAEAALLSVAACSVSTRRDGLLPQGGVDNTWMVTGLPKKTL